MTNHLAETCDGKETCVYAVDYKIIGNPAPGCRKDYIAEWQCGRDPERGYAKVNPGAGYSDVIELRCPVK